MFMVVLLHMGTFGIQRAININEDFSPYDQFIFHFLRSISIIAVNVYVLISAYFLCESKFSARKAVKLFLETSFFCTIMFLLNITFNTTSFDISQLKESIFALIFREYWFVTVYFVLLILSPYLNKFINSINKREHASLLLILFIVFCFWGFVIKIDEFGIQKGYSLGYFIFLYFLGSYIRKYECFLKKLNHNVYLLFFVILAVINTFIICQNITDRVPYGQYYFYNSPIVLLMTYSFFKYFAGIQIKSTKINFLSKYVFGVYLIHENPPTRQAIWIDSDLVPWILSFNDKLVMFHVLIATVILFSIFLVASMIIGFIFNWIYSYFEKLLIKS